MLSCLPVFLQLRADIFPQPRADFFVRSRTRLDKTTVMPTRSYHKASVSQPHNPGTQPWHRKLGLRHLPSKPRHFRLFLACLLVALALTLAVTLTQGGLSRDPTFLLPLASLLRDPRCPHVLEGATRGRWVPRPMTPDDVRMMDEFHLGVFRERHLNAWGQRSDERCGNVTFMADSPQQRHVFHPLFRALCDPRGPRPCCLQGRCADRTAEQCDCQECYDWRRQPHAEFARWETSDPRCQPLNFTGKEACRFLGNATLVFFGDSMIRDFYTAMLMLLRQDFRFGALKPEAPEDVRRQCEGLKIFGMEVCREHTSFQAMVCGGKVTLLFTGYHSARYAAQALVSLRSLLHRPSSFLVANWGFHDHLNVSAGLAFFSALHEELLRARATWPHLIWASTNAPGLLRSDVNNPAIFAQNTAKFRHYHEQTTRRIAALGVPVLDTWVLTAGAVSFDGIHVGLGLNLEKCRVLLTYLQQYLARPPGH